jgi:hypothetical protein
MPKLPAPPRPIGATVLTLFALILFAATLPASGQAAPPSSGYPLAATGSVFPKTTVGGGSEKLSVELTNVSGVTDLVTAFSVEGPDASDFVVNEFQCGILAPGDSCTAGIYFYPNSVGEKHAMLRLDLYNQGTEYIELSGTGVPAELTFSPPSHDFGIQSTHENANFTFQLTNSGEASAQLGNIEIPNLGGSVPFWTGNSNCWSLNRLQPGESCSMEVQFGPREAIAYTGELRASLNQRAFSAALSGEGGRPEVVAAENPSDLGVAPVGGVGPLRTITLTNAGNLSASFYIGIVAGGDAGSFRLIDENCSAAELMPGASCVVHVRLTPESAGPKVARLAFFGDGDSGTMVMLHGQGLAPALTLGPGGFDFGSQAKGTTSSARTFAVRNDGAAPASLGATTIVGSNLAQFQLAGDECTGVTLGPGQECLVRIRFAPTTLGVKTGTLRIASDGRALTASLSGTGVATEKVAARDSRSPRLRSRLRRGSTLSIAKAHCRSTAACRKARVAKHGGSHRRAAR